MSKRTVSALRIFPDHGGLRDSPRVLNLSKSAHSPVTVRIASPDVVRSPSILFRKLDAEVKADPCSKESVISALKKSRKRAVNLEKDDPVIAIPGVKDAQIKRKRNDNNKATSSQKSPVSDIGQVTKKIAVDDSSVFTCHGIVSKTPRNAITSSFSSSRLAANKKKRLFEETHVDDDDILVPSKKFIHVLQEKKLANSNENEVSVSVIGKISKQSQNRESGDLEKTETEADGDPKHTMSSKSHRKMPKYTTIGSSVFLPPSNQYEFTAKDLAETRYQAEERVRRFREEMREEEEQEQSKLLMEKKESTTTTTIPSNVLSTPISNNKELPQLTPLIKDQSNQNAALTVNSTGLLSLATTSGSVVLPGLNLQGVAKSSMPSLNIPSNPSTSATSIKQSTSLTPLLNQKPATAGLGMVSSVSTSTVSSTQLTTTFNFGSSFKNTPSTTQTTPTTALTPKLSAKNTSATLSLSGFSAPSKESSLTNKTLGTTEKPSSTFLTGAQGINFGGIIGTNVGTSQLSAATNTSVSTSIFTFGNKQPQQDKSATIPDFTKSSNNVSVSESLNTNIFGITTLASKPPTSSISSQQTSNTFQFTASGQKPGNNARVSTELFPSAAGSNFSTPNKNSFKPIFGDMSSTASSSITPSKPSFNPIFGTPTASKAPESGFKFNPISTSSAVSQTSAPAFTFSAKRPSGSGISSTMSDTSGNSSDFNFGTSAATLKNNSSRVNLTGTPKIDFNFSAPKSQPSNSGNFQFGQSSTQPSMTFGQSQAPPAFGQSQAPPAFGQSQTTPAFGQSAPTLTGFGQSNSILAFGQANQPAFTGVSSNNFGQTNQSSVFGQPNQSVPSFGQSSSQPAFGQTSNQGANTGFQFASANVPSFGQSGGFTQSSHSGQPPFGQQPTPAFGQGENAQQGFNFGGSAMQTPNFGSGGFPVTPTAQNPNTFSVGTGGTIARDRKKYAARRKVNRKR